jgi:hypothetical protein
MRHREIKKESSEQLRNYKHFKALYDSQVDKNGPVAQLYLRHMSQAQDRLKELKSII